MGSGAGDREQLALIERFRRARRDPERALLEASMRSSRAPVPSGDRGGLRARPPGAGAGRAAGAGQAPRLPHLPRRSWPRCSRPWRRLRGDRDHRDRQAAAGRRRGGPPAIGRGAGRAPGGARAPWQPRRGVRVAAAAGAAAVLTTGVHDPATCGAARLRRPAFRPAGGAASGTAAADRAPAPRDRSRRRAALPGHDPGRRPAGVRLGAARAQRNPAGRL